MEAFLRDVASILRAIPHPSVWVGAVVVLAAAAVLYRLTPLGKWFRCEAMPALCAFILLLAAALNVVQLLGPDAQRSWKRLRLAGTTLFSRADERPLNAYTYGNESVLFLNAYLQGRRLVVAADGVHQIWDDNGTSLDSAKTARELIFAHVDKESFPEALSPAQAAELTAQPHYAIGVPQKNQAVFVFGDDYPRCRDVYMFLHEETFYVVPGPLARRLLGVPASSQP